MILTGEVRSPSTANDIVRLVFSTGSITIFCFFGFTIAFVEAVRRARWHILVATTWVGILQPLFWGTDLIVAGVTSSEFSRFYPKTGPLIALYGAYLAYTWGLSLYFFIQTYRRNTGLKKTQAVYLLAAVAVLGVTSTLSFLPAWLDSQTLLAMLPSQLLLVAPLLVTYAMIKHRLMGVRTIIHRTTVWILLSIGLLLPLYATFRAVAEMKLSLAPADLAIILLLVFLLAHGYLRYFKPRLDHLFQRRAYDRRRVLDRFESDKAAIGKPDDVVDQLMQALNETLYPEHAAVVFRDDSKEAWRRITRGPKAPAWDPVSLDPDDPFIRLLARNGTAVDRSVLGVDESLRRVRAEAEAHFTQTKAEIVMPLLRGEELVGLIDLGYRQSLQPYTHDDLNLLERLGAAATIRLSNALLFDRVDEQRRDLEGLTINLEARVKERTLELEEVNRRLTKANDDLKQLDRLKSRFFANISHELRTPLTLILSPLHSMLAGTIGSFDETQQESLAGIRRSALELLKLIEDLLDLSRLEEARLRLHIEPVSLRSLLARLVDYAKPLAERKGIRTELVVRQDLIIEADENKLERVFVNLLTNAYKFTQPGGEVRVTVDQRVERAVVLVEDTGIGIPTTDLDRIFERFHQVDDSPTRAHGGTGIGLSLAKELVDLHGGSIKAASELGKGSTFTVLVPVNSEGLPPEVLERRQEALSVPVEQRESDLGLPEWLDEMLAKPEVRFLGIDAVTERRVAPRSSAEISKRARLLVVDDNPDVLKYLQQVLKEEYELWLFQDGERAWEFLLRDRHDLVLADIMMPGVSGLDLCRRIKENPHTQDTPVILLTARGDIEHRLEGHGVGADHYVTKPFDPSELMAIVDNLLAGRIRRTEAATRRRTASLETLLGGIAHELRNACHQIQGSHSVIWELSRQAIDGDVDKNDEILKGRLEKMNAISQRALSRISRVVQRLRQYASQGMQVPWRDHEIDELVAKEIRAIEAANDKEIDLRVDLNAGVVVRGPTEELRQLVANLVENAIHAVAPRGVVEVRTEPLAGRARFSVKDDGPGMPPEVKERVFDPFFTTKPPGQGMGLGLALCKKTVTDLGGTIEFDSRVGVGTVVNVELPTVRVAGAAGLEAVGVDHEHERV